MVGRRRRKRITFVFLNPALRCSITTLLPDGLLLPLTNIDNEESRTRRNEAAMVIGRSSKSFVWFAKRTPPPLSRQTLESRDYQRKVQTISFLSYILFVGWHAIMQILTRWNCMWQRALCLEATMWSLSASPSFMKTTQPAVIPSTLLPSRILCCFFFFISMNSSPITYLDKKNTSLPMASWFVDFPYKLCPLLPILSVISLPPQSYTNPDTLKPIFRWKIKSIW